MNCDRDIRFIPGFLAELPSGPGYSYPKIGYIMRSFLLGIMTLALGAAPPVLATIAPPPCAPAGGSVDVSATNPSLAGYGDTASITGCTGMDADPGRDDNLGNANVGSSSTSITISNNGDNLTAPSGETGDGSPGDDCFEVYFVWEITYQVELPFAIGGAKLGANGVAGGGGGAVITITMTDTVESGIIEVCPC